MAPRHYFTLVHIEDEWITPKNAPIIQQQTIPELLHIIQEILPHAKKTIAIETMRELLNEIAILSKLSSQAIANNTEIPVVYEGFHLANDETSVIVEMMAYLTEMISENFQEIKIPEAGLLIQQTFRDLFKVVQSAQLRDQYIERFHAACSNSMRKAS